MSMQPYSSMEEMMAWRDFNRFVGEAMSLRPRHIGELVSRFSKPLDLYETANGYEIHYPLAGAQPESIEVTVHNNAITMSWETVCKMPAEARQLWGGMQYGKFQEQFTLPAELEAKSAGANYENGVLYIHVAKASPESSKTIRIIPESAQSKPSISQTSGQKH